MQRFVAKAANVGGDPAQIMRRPTRRRRRNRAAGANSGSDPGPDVLLSPQALPKIRARRAAAPRSQLPDSASRREAIAAACVLFRAASSSPIIRKVSA